MRRHQKVTCGSSVISEGLSLLSSDQSTYLSNYTRRKKKSFENYAFDGNLYDAYKYVFKNSPDVLKAMSDSIKDEHCTKQFYHSDVMEEQFEHFCDPEPQNNLWMMNVRVGCALVKESMKVVRLEPVLVRTEEDLFKIWTNLKASAGLANHEAKKKDSVHECFQLMKRIKNGIKQGVDFDKLLIPSLAYHRGQISGFIVDGEYSPETLKMKDRLVWCMDGGSVSVEGQYAKPLIEYLAEHWYNYAGGKDPDVLRKNIMLMRDKWAWTGLDFSKFDQTLPSWLIEYCFSVVKSFFDEKYHQEIDWICYNFIHTKIAMPNGVGVKQKHKGVPSGSNFTQLIGSMANLIMVLAYIASLCPSKKFQDKMDYVRRMVQLQSNGELAIYGMGDDDLVFTLDKLDVEALSRYVLQVFGVKINPDKTESGLYDKDPVFLKRTWMKDGEYQDPKYLTVNTIHNEHHRSYEGYSPWHIMYGLYLTYYCAFKREISEFELLHLMETNGGISALENIPRHDLPGVLRSFGDDALRRLRYRAEHLYRKGSIRMA